MQTAPVSPSVVGREISPTEPRAPSAPSVSVPAPGRVAVPPALAAREVRFSRIVVEGATAFGPAQYDPLLAPVLNQRLPLGHVVEAVNRIAGLYEAGGYVFYSVVLPQQELDGDVLRVIVIEASISRIDLANAVDSPSVRERVADLLSPLIGKRPLKKAELERALLLASDTPGLTISARALPDPGGSASRVVLQVDGSFKRFQPIAQVDSFQTTPEASVNFRVGGIGNSLLFGGDALELRYITSLPWDRLHLLDARYGVPIGSDGGRLSLLGQAVWQRPILLINGQAADYRAESMLGRVQYSHPFVRRLTWSVYGLGMVDVIGTEFRLQGVGIPGDSLRVLRAGLAASVIDDIDGVWSASLLTSYGLDTAGAYANGRFSTGPAFFKANLALQRAQPIGKNFTFVARALGQMTGGTVPAAELFSFGGGDFGRGFNVSESVSDRGLSISGELRYAIDWFDIDKETVDPQVYVFADHGWLSSDDWRNRPYFDQGASAGGGVRVRLFGQYTGDVELARAIASSPVDVGSRPWRVSFRLGTRL